MLRRRVAIVIAILVTTSACSGGPDLNEADRLVAIDAVATSASSAGVTLSDLDQECVVDELSTTQARELLDSDEDLLSQQGSAAMAEALVDCVGAESMVRSGLISFAGGVSEESGTCLGESFDKDLLSSLLSSQLAGDNQITTEIEIEIGLVLGLCLSPAELLELHTS